MSFKKITEAPGPCASTVAGWVWYCDEHDTHGNADSKEEAEHVAAAHQNFSNDGDEGCPLRIYFVAYEDQGLMTEANANY